MKQKAFTLIELLVVVAKIIIGVDGEENGMSI